MGHYFHYQNLFVYHIPYYHLLVIIIRHTQQAPPSGCIHTPDGRRKFSWSHQAQHAEAVPGRGRRTSIPKMDGSVIWLVVSNMFLCSISYMGCHPSHWLSYFSEGLKPPTSHVLLLLFLRNCQTVGALGTSKVVYNSVPGWLANWWQVGRLWYCTSKDCTIPLSCAYIICLENALVLPQEESHHDQCLACFIGGFITNARMFKSNKTAIYNNIYIVFAEPQMLQDEDQKIMYDFTFSLFFVVSH